MTVKSDEEIRAEVLVKIDSIPSVNAGDVEVLVSGGFVTLDGHVDTHQTRFRIERVARQVPGARGLKICIRPAVGGVRKQLPLSSRGK